MNPKQSGPATTPTRSKDVTEDKATISPPADDYGVRAGEWFDVVRRARLSPGLYTAALTLGSYATTDGTRIYCGTARLSLDLDCSYRTAQRHLAELRRIGLVERTKRVRLRGRSDEYRLILGPDLLEHVDIPDPDKYKRMVVDIRDQTRRGRLSRTGQLDDRYTDPYRTNDDARTGHLDVHPSTSRHLPVELNLSLTDTPLRTDLKVGSHPQAGELDRSVNGEDEQTRQSRALWKWIREQEAQP